MRVSVVIPCYNEEKNLPVLFNKLKPLIMNQSCEICLVDNGSIDNTYKILKDFESKEKSIFTLRIKKNKGYGYGILKGLQASTGEILSWTHADIQTNPEDILQGISLFEKHGKNIFVKGNRYGRPILDRFFTFGMSIFVSIFLKRFLWDVNAQPTMFSSDFFKTWSSAPNDFSLDLFAYFSALNKKIRIYRFPVRFDKRLFGKSSWNINIFSRLNFIIRTIKSSIKLKKNIY